MPSLVTGVIGGIQARNAAKNAAKKQAEGYRQAGVTVTDAVNQVNPEILETARQAGEGVTTAAQQGAAGATTAADTLMDLMSPYIGAGASAAEQLPDAAKPFTASMMAQYSPAYQFTKQQGELAAQRAAAAGGVTGSGGTMRSLTRYNQDYARTAFKDAADIYGKNFDRLATLADIGRSAATTGGQAGLQAAEYGGDLGMRGAEYAGTQNIGARNLASSNTLSGANYLANTQIGAQNALAQGDLGAAQAWNNMLGQIGQAGNTIAMAGFGGGVPGTTSGWGWGNIGKNLGSIWG